MCSIQDAFPDLNFSNTVSPQEQKISQAKSELLKMQEERGKMMTFQCSDVTTPYFLQNQPNMPHIAETTLAGDFSVPASTSCNCLPGMCVCSNNNSSPSIISNLNAIDNNENFKKNVSSFTPEIITNTELLKTENNTELLKTENNTILQDLVKMVDRLDNKVNNMEYKYNRRNSHDMLLFIVIVIFVILVVDTLMKS
jgi:hypothetical protein